MSQDELNQVMKDKFPDNQNLIGDDSPVVVRRRQDPSLSPPAPVSVPANDTPVDNKAPIIPVSAPSVPAPMPQAVAKIIEDNKEAGLGKINIKLLQYYYTVKNKFMNWLNIVEN